MLFRLYVKPDNLEKHISFYEKVFGERTSLRFHYPDLRLELAKVGPVLLIAGEEAALAKVSMTAWTCLVDDLQEAKTVLLHQGAQLLEDIKPVPTGWNMRVLHPDGTVVEYVQWR